MEIVCDCANARVAGEGHLGAKPLDGSDQVEQAEKIAQARHDDLVVRTCCRVNVHLVEIRGRL